MNRNFGLDVLRALAIILVLLSHSRFLWVGAVPEARYLQLGGFWGVELFFVLSGLLIGRIIVKELIDQQDFTLATFWKRRWYRTIPNYFLFLFLNILYLLTIDYSGPPLWKYFFFMQNLAWQHPSFFPESWSLAVEEMFYLLFPVLVVLLMKARLKPGRAFLTAGISILCFSTTFRFVHVAFSNPNWNDGVRTIVIYRLDALMYGLLLAFYLNRHGNIGRRLKHYLSGAGSTLLIASAIVFFSTDRDADFFSRTALFSVTSLGFALLMPAAMDARVPGNSLIESFWRKISLWSYSLYLSNLLVYNLIRFFWLDVADRSVLNAFLATVIYVAASVSISALVYRHYELPVMELRDRSKVSQDRKLEAEPA
jgi:peptidoglycan/LPS O-acetylase OafA/YrhL